MGEKKSYFVQSLLRGSLVKLTIFPKHLRKESMEKIVKFYGFVVSLFPFERMFSDVLDFAIFNGITTFF